MSNSVSILKKVKIKFESGGETRARNPNIMQIVPSARNSPALPLIVELISYRSISMIKNEPTLDTKKNFVGEPLT